MSIITVEETSAGRQISCSWPVDVNGKIVTLAMWAKKNLSADDYEKWVICDREHEEMVDNAVKNNHATRDSVDGKNSIHWLSVEIHREYQAGLCPVNDKFYHEVWKKFRDDQESISASSY